MTVNEAIDLYENHPEQLILEAARVTEETFENKVYIRGLIEFSNFCHMDCLYCGIRKSNTGVNRYRLSPESIMSIIEKGQAKDIKTFVLQSGEDRSYTTEALCRLLEEVRRKYGESVAVTLSCGLRSRQEYEELFAAGANRYLMRFETSDPELHRYLRNGSTLKSRLKALETLREIGYETGSGYMTGLPGETEETRIQNALLSHEFGFDMLGIGPFIPHPETPLGDSPQESLKYAILGTALLRVLLPEANIPATTAAGTLSPQGRERMMAAGANVLMPNLTPVTNKKDYLLYPNKICLDESGFQCIGCLSLRTKSIDKQISFDRGDSPHFHRRQNG